MPTEKVPLPPCARQSVTLALLLFLSSWLAWPARGDSAEEARAAYQQATAEYNLGRYGEALALFEKAFKLKQVPALLFNIAQCHRQLQQFERAATSYRSFIRLDPKNKQLPLAKKLLRDVEEAIKSEASAVRAKPPGLTHADPSAKPEAPPPSPELGEPSVPATAGEGPTVAAGPPQARKDEEPVVPPTETSGAVVPMATAPREPPRPADEPRPAPESPRAASEVPLPALSTEPPAPRPGKPRVFTWVAAGGAALALGLGGVYGLQSKSTASQIESGAHSRSEVDKLQGDLRSQAGRANLLFVAGGVLAATAGAFYVLEF